MSTVALVRKRGQVLARPGLQHKAAVAIRVRVQLGHGCLRGLISEKDEKTKSIT